MQKLTAFLFEKWWLTLALIIGFYYIPFMGWVSVILVALLTLALDVRFSWMAVVALLAPNIIASLQSHQPLMWLVLVNLIFVWAAALVLRRSQSWSEVFNLAAVVIIVLIPVMYWLNPQIQAGWANFWMWLINITGALISNSSVKLTANGINFPLWQSWLALLGYLRSMHIDLFLPKISTGLLIVGYILGNLFNLLLARGWYLKYQAKLSVVTELRTIRLHIGAALALVLALVCNSAWLDYRLDILCALAVLFFLAGLSLAYWLAHRWGKAWLWLGLFYLALTLMPMIMSLFLVVLAFIDSIVDVRKRLMKEVISDGSHPA